MFDDGKKDVSKHGVRVCTLGVCAGSVCARCVCVHM